MSWGAGKFLRFSNGIHLIGDAVAAICHQRTEEQQVMKAQRRRTVISRAVGAGLVAGGLALGVAALAGSPAEHVTDNAQLGDSVWINTPGVSTVGTVGTTSLDILPGDTKGNTVVGLPGPSIAVTDGNAPGNTVIWFPGGAIVTGSTFAF
jgi:hypothetical protein